MNETAQPTSRRLPTKLAREARRARIFGRISEGWAYPDIADAEGLTDRRIRQIVNEALKKRTINSSEDHALLQLSRIEPALRLAGEAVARGETEAIGPYLKLIDRLDRYQPAARAKHVYDAAARERLYAKLSRAADRLLAEKARRKGAPPRPAEEGGAGQEEQNSAGSAVTS